MVLNNEQIQCLAEMECCTQKYFDARILPIMESVERRLIEAQKDELIEYSTSIGGILGSMGTYPGSTNTQGLEQLKINGEWNSKTTEDYLGMCREEIAGTDRVGKDLKALSNEWQKEIKAAIGDTKYEKICKTLGRDAGEAYLEFRLEQLMIDKMVKDKIPKSSMEYIIRSATENSIFGIGTQINRTPLDDTISGKAEKGYAPNKMEKTTGSLIGFGLDTLATGGLGSWSRIGTMAAIDIGTNMVLEDAETDEDIIEHTEKTISKEVFGAETNILNELRRKGEDIFPHDNKHIREINEKMDGRLNLIPEENMEWMEKALETHNWAETPVRNEGTSENIPYIIRPGKEEEFIKEQEMMREENKEEPSTRALQQETANKGNHIVLDEEIKKSDSEDAIYSWGGLLKSSGLNGLGGLYNNLGYVIAKLPDMIGGMITGKTQSLKLSENLLPIASIICGMFVRNPLLRMLLVGGGGLNILNKAGHEALGEAYKESEKQTIRYKTYDEEKLNSRIENPQIKGSYLFITIDNVPCSVKLPTHTAEAYHSGALPLNTLANAVLRKNDELQDRAMKNYEINEHQSDNKGLTMG